MREYDDDIRPFVPVVQRLIILVAVIVAVPVVLWTITAFIRTYIGPPHAPNYQHIAILQPADRTADSAPVGPPQDIAPAAAATPAQPTSAPVDQTATLSQTSNQAPEPNGARRRSRWLPRRVSAAPVSPAPMAALARFGNGPAAGANCAGQSRFRGAGSDRGRR